MNSIGDVSIVMRGASEGARRMAALLINNALTEQGFLHVDVLNNHGREMEIPEYVPSMLEMLRAGAPKLFNSLVTVQEIKVRQYYGEEVEDG
jgi:hypothetical protein